MPSKVRRKPKARKTRALTSREKVRAHRKRLRARGLRPVTIWVPDTRSADFMAEARRQASLLARSPYQKDDQAFIDTISDWKSD
jgi:hypothetical protein